MAGRTEQLADNGLIEVEKYVTVFFDPHDGWTVRLCESKEEMMFNHGFVNKAGDCTVKCVVPVEMLKEYYQNKGD